MPQDDAELATQQAKANNAVSQASIQVIRASELETRFWLKVFLTWSWAKIKMGATWLVVKIKSIFKKKAP